MKNYAQEMGFDFDPVTPDDPQCNGFAENFVKVMCKMLHTAVAEGKEPKEELYKYLLHYRATPHSTTGKSPAEMLFNRRVKTKLPQVFNAEETQEQKDTRELHDKNKMKQKHYFDKRHKAKPKLLEAGDKVLVKQSKSTTKPPFDPNPYTVSATKGNRVFLDRSDGKRGIRDKNKVKKVLVRPPHLQLHKKVWIEDPQDSTDDEFPPPKINHQAITPPDNNDMPPQPDESVNEEVQVGENETASLQGAEAVVGGTVASEQPFVVDANMENRLQQLLLAAANNGDARTTRSQGTILEWSRTMDPDNVIAHDDD